MIKLRALTHVSPEYAQAARDELESAREHYANPENKESYDFTVYGRDDLKVALSALSFGKCAYCEFKFGAGSPMDVEHFRPKGRCISADGNKKFPAYWWLAANLDNLLPSCIRCNRVQEGSGKGEHFPILNVPHEIAENCEGAEQYILIHPYLDEPADFISFRFSAADLEGEFRSWVSSIGDSLRGRASIEILGLNRKGLVEARTCEIEKLAFSLVGIGRDLDRLDNAIDYASIAEMKLRLTEDFSTIKRLYLRKECGFYRSNAEFFAAWLRQRGFDSIAAFKEKFAES